MCTVSVIPTESSPGCRLVCNRDESPTRAPALPPQQRAAGDRQCLYPVDGKAGGTWLGVNNAGLAVALLNRTAVPAPNDRAAWSATRQSRGIIIPPLLALDTVAEATAAAERIHVGDYPHFLLLILNRHGGVAYDSSPGRMKRLDTWGPGDARLFATSGLGDAWVDPPRRGLFHRMRTELGLTAAMQDAFHDSGDPEHPECGVMMLRPGARTVSRTVLELTDTNARMTYTQLDEAGLPERTWPPQTLTVSPPARTTPWSPEAHGS